MSPQAPDLKPGQTIVVFRKLLCEPQRGDVIALFPAEDEGDGLCLSYMHVGQHSAADYYGLLDHASVPATPAEYADLKAELESIGYDLAVRRAFSRKLLGRADGAERG